jgi:hypothetical protein
MAKRQYTTLVVLNRTRLNQEYFEALRKRTGWVNDSCTYENVSPRIIRNPSGAMAVASVIDQIPRVKAELDKADRRRHRRR